MDDLKAKSKELQNLDLSGNSHSKSLQLDPQLKTKAISTKSTGSRVILAAGVALAILLLTLGFKVFALIALLVGFIMFFSLGLIKKSVALTSGSETSNSKISTQKTLKNILFGIQYLENIDNLGEKVFAQFELLEEKYKFYIQLLGTKFSPNEITYQRYATAVDNIYQAITDNFMKLSNTLTVLSKIEVKGLSQELQKATSPEQKTLLEEQIDNYSKKMNSAKELLSLNQAAILQLEKLSFALNDIKSSQTASEDDLKIMMKDLQELADRAHKYSL